MSDGASLALAFGTGMVATVNPCGFAMLPAYLAYFVGTQDDHAEPAARVMRAIGVSIIVSLGFFVVFGVMGAIITTASLTIERYLPWVTIAIAIALVGLGIAMLRGFEPVVSVPHLDRGGRDRRLPSMFLFGVSFALSSLSCTMPLYLTNVANTFTQQSFAAGVAVSVAYAAGMALVLTALTITLALARQGLVRRLRSGGRHLNRVAGGLLVVAGSYLAYYGWYELQVYAGNDAPGGPADLVFRANSAIAGWISSVGAVRLGVLMATAIGVVVALSLAARAPRGGHRGDDRDGGADRDGASRPDGSTAGSGTTAR